jgi:hypothetical protein
MWKGGTGRHVSHNGRWVAAVNVECECGGARDVECKCGGSLAMLSASAVGGGGLRSRTDNVLFDEKLELHTLLPCFSRFMGHSPNQHFLVSKITRLSCQPFLRTPHVAPVLLHFS